MENPLGSPFWLRYLPASLCAKIKHRPDVLKVLNNVAWLFSDKILRMGVGLVVSVWIARHLGPVDFGLFSFAIAVVSLFGVFATLGLSGIMVRDLANEPENSFATLGSGLVLQVIGGVIAFSFLLILSTILRPDEHSTMSVITIIGLTLLLKGSDCFKSWFDSQVQSKYSVWAENTAFLVASLLKVGLIVLGASLLAFAWITLVESLLTALMLFIMYEWAGGGMRVWRFTIARAQSLLQQSWPLILSGLAVMVYMRIDQVMLGQMLNDEAVGIYSAAVRLSEAWYFVPMAIVSSVFPTLLDAKKTSEVLYLEKFQQLYDMLVVIALVVAIPVTFLADPIVAAIFGQEYLQAGTILSIHIWAALFVFLGVVSGKWFLAENRQLLAFHRVSWGMGINIVLNVLWIPEYGGVGAAWATLISQAVASMLIDVVYKETRLMFKMKLKACLLTRVLRMQYST